MRERVGHGEVGPHADRFGGAAGSGGEERPAEAAPDGVCGIGPEGLGGGGVGPGGVDTGGAGPWDVGPGDVGPGDVGGEGDGAAGPPGWCRPAPRVGPARPRGWRVARRRGPGPRPVRPLVVAGSVRPAEVPRPVGRPGRTPEVWWVGSAGPRVLRRAPGRHGGLRRAVAGAALAVAAAAAVVALGLLASLAAPAAGPAGPAAVVPIAPAAPVDVTVEPGETVWDVADRVAPGLPGARRAALAERIVRENGLGSARPAAGRVLRVPVG